MTTTSSTSSSWLSFSSCFGLASRDDAAVLKMVRKNREKLVGGGREQQPRRTPSRPQPLRIGVDVTKGANKNSNFAPRRRRSYLSSASQAMQRFQRTSVSNRPPTTSTSGASSSSWSRSPPASPTNKLGGSASPSRCRPQRSSATGFLDRAFANASYVDDFDDEEDEATVEVAATPAAQLANV